MQKSNFNTISLSLFSNQATKAQRDLMFEKMKAVVEGDSESFDLKLYCADSEVSLESPTKTMALVMSFIENNNKLLAQVKDLESQVQLQANSKEVVHQLEMTTREELKKVRLSFTVVCLSVCLSVCKYVYIF